jgi:hypothetical protein
MATSIRYSHQVDSAFKQLMKRFETTKKKINSSAAKRMKSGQYEAATQWMQIGRAFDAFSSKIEGVRQEWHELVASSQKSLEEVEAKPIRTRRSGEIRVLPKQLYTPALKALSKRNGTASPEEMLADLHNHIVSAFPQNDLATNSPFKFPAWQKLFRKVYKYCQGQGLIERRKDGQWVLTEKGRSSTIA